MLPIAYYFLQVCLCSAVMMGYYWQVLRNKRFHQYNRFYLLGVLGLSWLIPLIKIQWNKPVDADSQVMQILSIVADNNTEIDASLVRSGFQFSWESGLIFIYGAGVALLLVLMLVSFFRLYQLLKEYPCKNVGDMYLIFTQAKGAPFSFFRYIFWHNAIDLKSEAGKQMLEHELTHVKEKHSIDKVLIQLVLVVGWFNPFFWLLKKEMEMIHEFIADKKAVQNGDSASLAQMLLTAAYPQHYYAMTNPFFFSPIKRRLQMITNHKNPRFTYLRRLVILPLLAIVLVLFAFRSKEINTAQPLSVSSLMETVVDKIKGNDLRLTNVPLTGIITLNKSYTIVVDAGHGGADIGAKGIDGKSTEAALTLQLAIACKEANTNPNIKILLTRDADKAQTVVDKANITNELKADLFISLHCNNAAPIIKEQKPTANPTKGIEIYIASKEKAVNYGANEMFAQQIGNVLKNNDYPFVGIKSRSQGIWVLQAVKCPSVLIEAGFMTDQTDLANMKDPVYQTKMANSILQGVQQYLKSTEMQNSGKDTTIILNGKTSSSVTVTFDNIVQGDGTKVQIKGNDSTQKQPLIILDGKVQPAGSMNQINPNSIESIDVLKDKSATVLYGEAGKNGVILIKSKSNIANESSSPSNYGVKIMSSSTKGIDPKVKYYIDGILSDSAGMAKIDPSSIARVDVLKGEKAVEKYGAEASYGVVQITTKANELNKIASQKEEDYEKIFTVTQIPAEFPGGTVAWEKYLQRNLKTDFLKQQNAPQGKYTVSVEFIVDKTGNVNSVHALNDPGYGTKEAAENLIKKGPMWRAAMQNGKTVVYKARREISFVM